MEGEEKVISFAQTPAKERERETLSGSNRKPPRKGFLPILRAAPLRVVKGFMGSGS